MTEISKINLFHRKRVEKCFLAFVSCSLCNQVVVNLPTVLHVSSKVHFAKVIRTVRKNFSFYKFYDISVRKQNMKTHESTRDHYEIADFF